jgi:hypothetical protein
MNKAEREDLARELASTIEDFLYEQEITSLSSEKFRYLVQALADRLEVIDARQPQEAKR